MTKVWFITGSARGLGRSLTEAVLANGDIVAAGARDPDQLMDLKEPYPENLFPLKLDVTQHNEIENAVALTIQHFGRIDVLVNNAGFGIIGAAEAYSDEDVAKQLAINLYAPIAITRAVLPYLRKQRSGRIIQISSTGGRVGSPGLTIYQAAKFGLGGFSEALAKEVKPLGILVTVVEPGGMRTGMTENMDCAPMMEGYEETVGGRIALFKGGKPIPASDPVKVAKVLIELAEHPAPPVHLVLGSDAVTRVQLGDAAKNTEMEKWLEISNSTDAEMM